MKAKSTSQTTLGSLLKECTIAGHVLLKKTSSTTSSHAIGWKRRYAVLHNQVLYIFISKLDEIAQPIAYHSLYPQSHACVYESGLWALQLVSPKSHKLSRSDRPESPKSPFASYSSSSLSRSLSSSSVSSSPTSSQRTFLFPSSLNDLRSSFFSSTNPHTKSWLLQCPGKEEMMMWLNSLRQSIIRSRFLNAELPPSPALSILSLPESSSLPSDDNMYQNHGRRPSCMSDISITSVASSTSSSTCSSCGIHPRSDDVQPIFELSIPEIPEEDPDDNNTTDITDFNCAKEYALPTGDTILRRQESSSSLSPSVAVDIQLSQLMEATRLHTISCPLHGNTITLQRHQKPHALRIPSPLSGLSSPHPEKNLFEDMNTVMGPKWSVNDMLATLDSMQDYHLGHSGTSQA